MKNVQFFSKQLRKLKKNKNFYALLLKWIILFFCFSTKTNNQQLIDLNIRLKLT